ncbi:MAG: SOS response-associated peptidase family protein, partial [Hyphomicrobiaceae bacterium]
ETGDAGHMALVRPGRGGGASAVRLWRHLAAPSRAHKEGRPAVELDVFAFMTTTPNALVATINHERMPVILASDEARATWLSGSPDEAFALAREHPPEGMRIVQAGLDKQDLLAEAGGSMATPSP